MSATAETGGATKDKDYDLVWYLEHCLENALRLQTYICDAERDGDRDVVDLFRKAQADSRKGAELATGMLAERIG